MSSKDFDIPSEDLTQERIAQWWALPTDRQRFIWALQTETRVRAQKVQQRDITPTLQTNLLLFDLYLPAPQNNHLKKYDPQIPKRHVSLYLRKSNGAVFDNHNQGREPDDIFNTTVYPLDLKPSIALDYAEPILPPNMLVFEMLLEAYCGYSLQGHFHHLDPNMPRAAIMGGAIVAVLMSWRDPEVMEMEEWEQLKQWFSNPASQQDSYEALIERLQTHLQDYFYGPASSSSSSHQGDRKLKGRSAAFVSGDVDVFLQPSPLTRALTSHLAQHGVEQDLLKRVAEYMGGFQLCEADLAGMSTALCDGLIGPAFEDIGPLVYSATQRGVSFAISCHDDEETHEKWPRNTQLIMLNERADLLGALFDFDISVAALAYDGINVRAAPRAVLSLLTNVLVVTPFVLAEKRNRQRIFKYCKKGFRPFMLDPFCGHAKQCHHDCCDLMGKVVTPMEVGEKKYPDVWHHESLDPDKTRGDPDDYGDRKTNVCDCSYKEKIAGYRSNNGLKYTFGVIAKDEEHLFDFLAKKNQWSLEHQAFVRSIHPMARKICRYCRESYMAHLVIQAGPPDFGNSVDELLHGEMCYVRQGFYGGGAFDSTAVRGKARTPYEFVSLLRAQEIAEKSAYLIRHGSFDGYKPRFTYGSNLEELLEEASATCFEEPHRRPLGLNPERFMAECEKCQKEMPEREYGTKFCDECEKRTGATEDLKPPAERKRPRTNSRYFLRSLD